MEPRWTPEPFEADDGRVPFERFIEDLADFKFVALDTAISHVLAARCAAWAWVRSSLRSLAVAMRHRALLCLAVAAAVGAVAHGAARGGLDGAGAAEANARLNRKWPGNRTGYGRKIGQEARVAQMVGASAGRQDSADGGERTGRTLGERLAAGPEPVYIPRLAD